MRTNRAQTALRPAQALFAVLGVALFVLLGMLGMHLHEAPSAATLHAELTVASDVEALSDPAVMSADTPPFAASAASEPSGSSLADARSSALLPGVGGGLGHLEVVTACMLALLVTMVLLAPRVWWISARRSAARAADGTAWARLLGGAAPARPLFVLLSISRT